MIARKSALIVATQFFTRFLGWLGLVILAKFWGGFAPELLGIIGFAMSFLGIFNILADLGFSEAHVKRISEGKDLGTCIGTYAAIKLILTGIMVTVVLVTIYVWKNFFNGNFTDATTDSVIIIFIVYSVFLDLTKIATSTFHGKQEIAKRQITNIFENIVKVPLEFIVILSGVSIAGVASISPPINWPEILQPLQKFISTHAIGSYAMTYVFSVLATFLVGLWFLRKYPIKKPSLKLFKSYFSFALPIMLISIIGVISGNVDKLMIGYFWDAIEVGYYYTVQQIISILVILTSGISVVLFPTFSGQHSNKNLTKIKETIHSAERYISMVMVPPVIVIIVFAAPVINIMLSSSFLPATSVLIPLTINAFISSLIIPYSSLISGINRPGIAAKIGFVIFITNIFLNYLFIPSNGLLSFLGINGPTGAAIATTTSSMVGFIGLRVAAKKLTGIKLIRSHIFYHITAGVIMGVLLYVLAIASGFFPVIQWYHFFFFAGLGLIIYLSILYLLKEFDKKDLLFFINMIHPKEMFRYVKSELKEDDKKRK